MEEIHYDRRQRRPLWPWIIGAIALVLFFSLISNNREKDRDTLARTETESGSGEEGGRAQADEEGQLTGRADETEDLNSDDYVTRKTEENRTKLDKENERASSMRDADCIREFDRFVSTNSASKSEGINHDYTHDGLRYLSCSLSALVSQSGSRRLENKREQLLENASALRRDPESDKHPELIRESFDNSVDILESIQKDSHPELRSKIAELREACKDFDTDKSTLEQKDKVQDFFEQANQVIGEMTKDN
jgi:hypothetical protein